MQLALYFQTMILQNVYLDVTMATPATFPFYYNFSLVHLLKALIGYLYFLLTIMLLTLKVYPGQRAAGIEADMMAANELSAHTFFQVKWYIHQQKISKYALDDEFCLGAWLCWRISNFFKKKFAMWHTRDGDCPMPGVWRTRILSYSPLTQELFQIRCLKSYCHRTAS